MANGAADMALADVHDPLDDMFGGIGLGIDSASLAALAASLLEKGSGCGSAEGHPA